MPHLQVLILTETTQRIFDLWHGTVESYDGALQLLQISDFIWTWARDVYRPQVRRSLRGHTSTLRQNSPTSTAPFSFSRSQSVFSQSSLQELSNTLQDTVEEDVPMASEGESQDHQNVQHTSSHPFFQWANSLSPSAPWTNQACIRHSDIVTLSFRVLLMPESDGAFRDLICSSHYDKEDLGMMLSLIGYSFWLGRHQIDELQNFWTRVDDDAAQESSLSNIGEPVRVFFFFRTFCQPENWQIRREIYCTVWSWRAMRALSLLCGNTTATDLEVYPCLEDFRQSHEFIRAFEGVRNIFGRESVAYALDNTCLILRPVKAPRADGSQLQWASPSNHGITEAAILQYCGFFDAAANGAQRYHHQRIRIRQLIRAQQNTDIPTILGPVPEAVGNGGGMLAMKPSSWPTECPRLCLFVLLDSGFNERALIASLLGDTVRNRQIYSCGSDLTWTENDRRIFENWKRALEA